MPQALLQALRSLGGQGAARGEHPAHAAQGRPIEVVAHALEQRRAGDPGEGRLLTAGTLQVFREGQLPTHERTPGAQRPQHPEQQPVDVLCGNAADHAGRAQVGAPQVFQGLDLVTQLAQGFLDALGLAAGAGGAQAQPAVIEVQFGGVHRRLLHVVGMGVAGLVGQPQIHVRRPALACLRLQVGGKQDPHPGAPGTEQGDGQVGGIFQVHRHMPHAPGMQAGRQAQRRVPQLRVIQRRIDRNGAFRLSLEQHLLKCYPIHGRPLTRCRMSHSMANSSPINP
ncbi:hypothetical protein D3C76_1068560 [compost metagenome]